MSDKPALANPLSEAVSKREAIAALQSVGEFARKAAVAFSDLRTRCSILEVSVRHNSNDPISEEQKEHFYKLINDWEDVAKGLS